jgi:hypothetical protein
VSLLDVALGVLVLAAVPRWMMVSRRPRQAPWRLMSARSTSAPAFNRPIAKSENRLIGKW